MIADVNNHLKKFSWTAGRPFFRGRPDVAELRRLVDRFDDGWRSKRCPAPL
jgi:hypothetical protein